MSAFVPEEKPIDPGERLLAAIGVRPVISKAVERITAPQRKAALRLPSDISRAARDLCRGTTERPKIDIGEGYTGILKDLVSPYQEEQVEAMLRAFPVEAQATVGMPFKTVARRAFMYLQDRVPKSVYRSFAGSVNLRPNDPAWFKFIGTFGVLDNPLTVFELMGAGMLLRSQVDSMREIYPTVSEHIDGAIMAAVADAKVEKKSYQLPMYAEIGVANWYGQPIDLRPYQVAYTIPNKKPPQRERPAESALSKESLSGAQKTLYGQIGR